MKTCMTFNNPREFRSGLVGNDLDKRTDVNTQSRNKLNKGIFIYRCYNLHLQHMSRVLPVYGHVSATERQLNDFVAALSAFA